MPEAWLSTLFAAFTSLAGTSQASAAAATSIARAVAPALRICRYEFAIADEPPVPCRPPNARLA